MKKFDPKKMANDAVVLIIGKRRSGKSWIARDVLCAKQKIPVGIAMSGTCIGLAFVAASRTWGSVRSLVRCISRRISHEVLYETYIDIVSL